MAHIHNPKSRWPIKGYTYRPTFRIPVYIYFLNKPSKIKNEKLPEILDLNEMKILFCLRSGWDKCSMTSALRQKQTNTDFMLEKVKIHFL